MQEVIMCNIGDRIEGVADCFIACRL